MKKISIKICLLVLTSILLYSCTEDDSSFIDGLPDAIINNDPDDAPARVVTETWNGHTDTIYREYFDNNVAVFFDKDVDRDIVWVRNFTGNVWEYIQNNYGGFNNNKRLWAVFHSRNVDPFSSNVFDQSTMNNNLLDVTLTGEEMNTTDMDNILTEISKIVENTAFNTNNSPASVIWENNFRNIFLYDVYTNLGMDEDAQRIKTQALESSSDIPVENTFWFKDFFLPVYENYEGVTTLSNFFQSLSQNFTKDGNAYARDLNFGEFIHFYSGATGDDLQPFAEEAFGDWTEDWQDQLLQARTEFPNVNYPFEPTSELKDLTTNATLTVSKDNGEGPEGREGSLKLIDNDINTKFLVGGLPADFTLWLQQELAMPSVVNKYTLTSGNDAPERDPRNWEFQGSNDGQTWEVLDTRTDVSFNERNQTVDFNIDNNTAYKYYRLFITENYGSDAVQISEFRLFELDVIGGPSELSDFTEDASLVVSEENTNGADSNEGSSKLIDGDINSKFLARYNSNFFMQQEFGEAKLVTKYTITSGNDAPDRDPVDWELSGSMDGNNWDVLDTRSGESFEGRNMTREFMVNNQTAYNYYRLSVTANNGSDAIQISEWRLYGTESAGGDGSNETQDFTGDATLTVNHDNPGGSDSGEGSLKLIDGDINTKFLVSFSSDLWMQQELPQAEVVNAYSITSGGDAPDRDLKDWELAGSNDGNSWEVLDTRSGEMWAGRNETKLFEFNNNTSYKFYRLTMTANNGSDGTQLSEWRLLHIN